MTRFLDLISEPAREMARLLPTLPAWQSEAEGSGLIRLDSNENPFGPSPLALEAMQAALASSHLYPDDDSTALRRKIAAHHDLPADQVLVTAGSSGLLTLLCRALLGPGINAVTSERTFVVYGLEVRAAGGQLIQTPMRGDHFDPQGLLDAIDANTRLVLIANPNNPTGTILDAAQVDEFLSRVPDHVVVVIDEAYYEFAAHFAALRDVEYSKSVEIVRRGASVVVLRSFSKAHGLAGLRIGYGLGPAELMGYCTRMRDIYSVSSLAQAAASAAMDDHDHVARTVANNAEQAKWLTERLRELGIEASSTWANFLYCGTGRDAASLALKLQKEGVSVRPLRAWGAPEHIRVSIGTPQQNQRLLDALRKIIDK